MMKGWTEIISFTYPHEAHLAKGFLESYELEVIIKDEFTVQVNNLYSNAIGGVKLFVEDSKAEEALLLLEDGGYVQKNIATKSLVVERFSAEYKTVCPYCKESNVTRKRTGGWIFVLSTIIGLPLPISRRVYYCYECGKEWKLKSTNESDS